MRFDREKLFLTEDNIPCVTEDDFGISREELRKRQWDVARRRNIAHNAEEDGLVAIDWEYYFAVLKSANRRVRPDALREMNEALIEAGVLCGRSPDCFGIIKNGYNLSHFSASDLNHGYYFAKSEYAHGYLNAAIKSGNARFGLDVVFQIHEIRLGIPKP